MNYEQDYKIKEWFAARDEDETLHVFQVEPRKIVEDGRWWDRDYISIEISKNAFPELTWEDEPIEVELTIKKI